MIHMLTLCLANTNDSNGKNINFCFLCLVWVKSLKNVFNFVHVG